MSRWFRFYDDSVNDPKLLRLPDDLYRAWTILLCFASKNEGTLPPADDIALALRMKPAKVCEWITKLVRAGLIDQTGNSFAPHNWGDRQYKSDSSAERMKRHRHKQRDVTPTVTSDVTVTVQNRTETETETEQIQKDSEANASGAEAPPDPAIPERDYFIRGREVLGSKSGAMIANLLKAKGRNVALARAALEEASQKQSPVEYVAAICRGGNHGNGSNYHRTDPAAGRATAREAHHVATMGGAALRYLQEGKSTGPRRDSPDGAGPAGGPDPHKGTENAH